MKLHPKDAPNSVIKGRHRDRLRQTVEFVDKHTNILMNNVLFIGNISVFDRRVYDLVPKPNIFNKYTYTVGDLDTLKWTLTTSVEDIDAVFCFEVLEHLLNPRLFLEQLKKHLTDDAIVFVSIPNHLLRRHWRTLHYHEIDPVRFEYLCEQAGYEIIDHVCYKYYPKLRDITGIRPFIRYITGYSWFISRTDRHFYALKHIK